VATRIFALPFSPLVVQTAHRPVRRRRRRTRRALSPRASSNSRVVATRVPCSLATSLHSPDCPLQFARNALRPMPSHVPLPGPTCRVGSRRSTQRCSARPWWFFLPLAVHGRPARRGGDPCGTDLRPIAEDAQHRPRRLPPGLARKSPNFSTWHGRPRPRCS